MNGKYSYTSLNIFRLIIKLKQKTNLYKKQLNQRMEVTKHLKNL